MTEEIEIPDGAPGVDDWVPWHPREVAARLGGVPVPWHVVGGWALDLWHGRATRDHEDLEIAVPRARFSALRPYLNGLTLYTAGDRRIIPLPEQADPPAHRFQVWVCDPAVRVWRMDNFARALPRLSDTARRWLADALRRAHPGHPWRQLLDGSTG